MKLSDYEMLPKFPDRPDLTDIDGSPYTGKGCYLQFGEEYALSIITGSGSYSTESQPYEVAIFRNEAFCRVPGISNPDDDVVGYLTEEEVNGIILKLYTITGKEPVQCFREK